MSFLKNPFRKTAPTKSQQKPISPATANQRTPANAQGVKAGTAKSSLPSNYLDRNVF